MLAASLTGHSSAASGIAAWLRLLTEPRIHSCYDRHSRLKLRSVTLCAMAGSQAGARLHAVKSLLGDRNIRLTCIRLCPQAFDSGFAVMITVVRGWLILLPVP